MFFRKRDWPWGLIGLVVVLIVAAGAFLFWLGPLNSTVLVCVLLLLWCWHRGGPSCPA